MNEDDARSRFMMISLLRLAGGVLVLFGILLSQGMFGLPEWTGYILIAFGLFDFFVLPTLLAKRWSSNDK